MKSIRETLLHERGIRLHRVYPIGFNVVQTDEDAFYILPAGCMIDAYYTTDRTKVKCRVRYYNRASKSLGSSAFTDCKDFYKSHLSEINRMSRLGTIGHEKNHLTLARKRKPEEEAYWSLHSDTYRSRWDSLDEIIRYTNGEFRLSDTKVKAQRFFSGLLVELRDRYDIKMAAELVGTSTGHYNQLIRTGLVTAYTAYALRKEVGCNRREFFRSLIELNKLNSINESPDPKRLAMVTAFRTYRVIHGVTVGDLANKLDMIPSSIYNLELGTTAITRPLIYSLVDAIDSLSIVPDIDLKHTVAFRQTLLDHLDVCDPLPELTFKQLADCL